jgi:hypothetical protein
MFSCYYKNISLLGESGIWFPDDSERLLYFTLEQFYMIPFFSVYSIILEYVTETLTGTNLT